MDSEFPGGPKFVNGALYDPEREILWLLEDKSVFGFKKSEGTEWKLQSVFPKELPSSIPFIPDAAIRWHNKHQVLLSVSSKIGIGFLENKEIFRTVESSHFMMSIGTNRCFLEGQSSTLR